MRYGGLLFKEEKSSKGLLSGTKMVFFWSDFYETWSSRKIGDTAVHSAHYTGGSKVLVWSL